MIGKPLAHWSITDLNSLVQNRTEESKTLDFKRELHGRTDRDKVELCADFASFANTAGGAILFGVEESDGRAVALPGIAANEIDAEVLRVQQTLRSGVDPALADPEVQRITVAADRAVLAMHVPRSWRAPHLVKVSGAYRMYARNSQGKFPLDASEIRLAFQAGLELDSGIRRWRDDRLARVLANMTPAPLRTGPKLLLHMVPLTANVEPHRVSASQLIESRIAIAPIGAMGWDHNINLEGLVAAGGYYYTQVFRSGALEAVFSSFNRDREGNLFLESLGYEESVVQLVDRHTELMGKVGLDFPAVVMFAILGGTGARMAVDFRVNSSDVRPFDRDVLVLPDIVLDTPATDPAAALRPMFDAAWNASGLAHSFNYNNAGKWVGKRHSPVLGGGGR